MNIQFGDIGLALRNLRRNSRRTLVAVLTVAFGVVAFLLAGGFIAWIFQEIREATIHSQLGHIQIVRPGYFEKGIADPYSFLLPGNPVSQSVVEKTPGFDSLAPRLAFSGLISKDETSIPFLGEGVSPIAEQQLSSRMEILEGSNLTTDNALTTILGEGLARSLGAKPGDSVVLLATTAAGSSNAVEVKITGVFATMYKDYDDVALRLPISVAQKLMRVQGATSWTVLLKNTDQTETGTRYLEESLDRKEFEIVPWTSLADFYNKTVVLFSKQVSVMKFIIALIIVLTISNTQTMSVLERTTEIGTSLAIGLRSRQIMWLFMLEGAFVGVAGGIAGMILGYLFAAIISAIGIPMPPPPGMAHGYLGKIIVTAPLAVDAFIMALTTTLIASIMPAWKASKMNIVDALRCNQ